MSNYRIIYGKNTVTEAIKNSSVIEVYIASDKTSNKNIAEFDNKSIEKLALSKKIDVKYNTKQEMSKLANGNHQGVCAKFFESCQKTFVYPDIFEKFLTINTIK